MFVFEHTAQRVNVISKWLHLQMDSRNGSTSTTDRNVRKSNKFQISRRKDCTSGIKFFIHE